MNSTNEGPLGNSLMTYCVKSEVNKIMQSRTVVTGFLVLFALLGIACGDVDKPTDISSRPVDEQALHFRPDDADAFLLSSGENVVVVTAGVEGDLKTWHADKAGHFEPVQAGKSGDVQASLLWATATKSGFMAFGRSRGTGSPVIWRSGTGRDWEQVAPEGLEGMAQLGGVTGVPGHFYAVGSPVTDDQTGLGSNAPIDSMWESADGMSWKPLQLNQPNVSFRKVITSGDTLVAIGTVDNSQGIWRSKDNGQVWQRVPFAISEGIMLVDLAVRGDTVVAVGLEDTADISGTAVLVSTDSAKTWTRVTLDKRLSASMGEIWSVHTRPDGFWIPGMVDPGGPFDSNRCYDHIDSCANPPAERPVVLSSSDGQEWDVLDASGWGSSIRLESTKLIMLPSGEALLLGADTTGLVVWRIAKNPDLPPGTTLPSSVPSTNEPMAGEVLDLGVRYRYPLYIHCGLDFIKSFNGTRWSMSDGEDISTGSSGTIPDRLPIAGQTLYGYVTLVAPDRIEYSLKSGEVLAGYTPAPPAKDGHGCA